MFVKREPYRAGRNEGTAITFITPSEYKQLMFIQRIAKAEIKRSKIPGVNDIILAKRKKISDDLTVTLKDEIGAEYRAWAKELLADKDPAELLAAVLNYCFEDELNPDVYGDIADVGSRGRQIDQQGKARLFVSLGRKDRINEGKLVELITSRVQINPRYIRDVQIMDKFSFLTVPFDKAEQVVVSFKGKGRKPLVTHARPDK